MMRGVYACWRSVRPPRGKRWGATQWHKVWSGNEKKNALEARKSEERRESFPDELLVR